MSSAPAVTFSPLGLSDLLDEAVKRSRRHFRTVYPPVAAPIALGFALMPLVQGFWFRGLASLEKGASPISVVPGMIAFMAVAFLALGVQLVGYSALLVGAVDATAGRTPSMAAAWRFVVRPRVLGTLVLSWLAILAGLVLCILPGIYLGLLFGLALPVMVDEGTFGTSALQRSSELARHNPLRDFGADPRFRIFVVVFVGILLGWAGSFAVQLPFVVAQQIFMFRDMAKGGGDMGSAMALQSWLAVPSNLLGALVQTATQVLASFGLSLVFFDTRARREGADLESAVRRLAEGPGHPAH